MGDRRSVITVGNFDGVHRGHAALIRRARELADPIGASVVAVSFDPHPMSVLQPGRAPAPLTDREQRRAALIDAGADEVVWLEPDPQRVLSLSPREFVERMAAEHHVAGWVEGRDFRFGHRRTGDMAALEELGREMGFAVAAIDAVEVVLRDKSIVPASSSIVRWLVGHGRIADAELVLGRPFAVRGSIVRGDQRGRQIGFPTINLDTGGRVLPADGVYGGWVDIDGRRHSAAISVGHKPTFGDMPRAFEAHLLDYSGDLYGRSVEVAVVRWLRDQQKYDGVDPLVAQMHADCDQVRRLCESGLLDAASRVMR